MDQNPKQPEIVKAAEQAFLLIRKDYPKYKLVKIVKAATQVVAGINYLLVLEFQAEEKIVTWEILLYEDLQHHFTITKKRLLSEPKLPAMAIPGGYLEQDPLNPEMAKVAKHGADVLQKEHPDYKLVKMHKIATQVVAGINYYIVLEFQGDKKNVFWEMVLYEDFSQNLSVTRQQELVENAQKDNEMPSAGGFTEQDVNHPDIVRIAKHAAEFLQKENPDYALVKIHKAASQVVAGINYLFVLEFAEKEKRDLLWEVLVYEDFSQHLSLVKKTQLK